CSTPAPTRPSDTRTRNRRDPGPCRRHLRAGCGTWPAGSPGLSHRGSAGTARGTRPSPSTYCLPPSALRLEVTSSTLFLHFSPVNTIPHHKSPQNRPHKPLGPSNGPKTDAQGPPTVWRLLAIVAWNLPWGGGPTASGGMPGGQGPAARNKAVAGVSPLGGERFRG